MPGPTLDSKVEDCLRILEEMGKQMGELTTQIALLEEVSTLISQRLAKFSLSSLNGAIIYQIRTAEDFAF